MSTKSWPYVSVLEDEQDPNSWDRQTGASEEAEGYDMFVASGVVPGLGDELVVTKVPDTLKVSIAPGKAVITGHRYIQDVPVTLSLTVGDGQPRIDIIALESNANTPVRAARFVVVKGTPAASPIAPTLTNDEAIQQQEYARMHVPAGATNLNGATLTDKRVFARGRHLHTLNFDLGDDGIIIWDAANKTASLQVAGCQPVQLAPMVLGTSPSPPVGAYPKGTLYIQYT